MVFDSWFNKQSTAIKVVLLVLPLVGWVVELLVRASIAFERKDASSIVMLVLFLVIGWAWILCVIDLIYFMVKGHLILE